MVDPGMQELLAQLASQAAKLDTLQARLAAHERRRARPGRLLPVLLLVLFVALTPLSLFAANPFNDLNPGSVHNDNIGLIYDAGITKGCDPDVSYCPNANVTREEMASFLARTAGLGSNPPVVNAKTAQTATNANHATSADTATSATNASHATTADTATTANTATTASNATNADDLGGVPASNFMHVFSASRIRYAPYGLVRLTSNATFTYDTGPAANITSTVANTQTVALPLTVPSPLLSYDTYAAQLRYCYKVSNANTKIVAVRLITGNQGEANVIRESLAAHSSTSIECVDISVSPNVRITEGLAVEFDINFNTNTHIVTLYSVQLAFSIPLP